MVERLTTRTTPEAPQAPSVPSEKEAHTVSKGTIEARYANERSATGRDAILTEATETYGNDFAHRLVSLYGWPDEGHEPPARSAAAEADHIAEEAARLNHEPTLDRDIRFSVDEIRVTQYALRDEIKRRTRSIEKAEAAQSAGGRVQANVLQSHYADRDHARAVLAALEVARQQIARRLAELVERGQ